MNRTQSTINRKMPTLSSSASLGNRTSTKPFLTSACVVRILTFVEWLIGTIRREYLDHVTLWNVRDLERKPSCFQDYFNHARAHQGIGAAIPEPDFDDTTRNIASLDDYRWRSCSRGLYQLPIAA